MVYELKNCRDGSPATYPTTVEISENNGRLTFTFTCENTQYYCPHSSYNDIHSEGDACEVLIGTDPRRKEYYEIEISAKGELMTALMVNNGFDESGEPQLDINFVDVPFVTGRVEKTENGYIAEVSFDKEKIFSGEGEVYFNAYRLETDGGEMDKHLFALSPTHRPKFHDPKYFLYLKEYV